MKPFLFIFSLIILCSSVVDAKENATWIRSLFFRGFDPITKKKLVVKDIEDLATRLKKNNIHYAYIFSGPFDRSGHLPGYVFSHQAKESISTFKKIYPDLKILPWIGGVQNKTVHLEKMEWVQNAIGDITKLVNVLPVDGIHLDLEYILYPEKKFNLKKIGSNIYAGYWITFHKLLRNSLPNTFLSTVVVSSATGTKPWKYKHSFDDIKKISPTMDQISFMFYETSIHDQQLYRENLLEQLQQIQKIKAEHKENFPQYLLGIGTFDSEKKLKNYRDLRFENNITTLTVLKELEEKINSPKSIIDGLAIYSEWETTDSEWADLHSFLKN